MSSQSPQECKVISAGVDWITATSPTGTRATLLGILARRWRDQHESEGNKVKAWGWEGYVGFTMDSISSGTRHDGTIVRLSGDYAQKRASQVLALADNVSRLDLQVTIQEENPCVNHATRALAAARLDRRVKAGMTKTSLITSTPDGITAYIGTRISQRFYRIYDKCAESGGAYPPGCWRYEAEYKGQRAISVGARLQADKDHNEAVRGVVEQAFGDYGVELPCSPLPRGWRDTSPRTETTDERRLRWLERCIAPCIGRMMESFDRRTVLEALGIMMEEPTSTINVETGEVVQS